MSPPDEELVRSAKSGRQDSFAALVERYQRKTYGLALHMLRNPEDAADATQEAFTRCYTALNRYDDRYRFGTWLYRIAYNYCLDVLRRRKHLFVEQRDAGESSGNSSEEALDQGPGVEDLVIREESVQQVSRALESLADDHRQILSLRYTVDLSYREIAEILEIPESTVTMRLHHAKRELRRQLSMEGEQT